MKYDYSALMAPALAQLQGRFGSLRRGLRRRYMGRMWVGLPWCWRRRLQGLQVEAERPGESGGHTPPRDQVGTAGWTPYSSRGSLRLLSPFLSHS